MNKYYRKIIIDKKEYDWCYKRRYAENVIMLYDVYYKKNKLFNTDVRKRKFIKSIQVDRNVTVTPKVIKYLIHYGYVLSKQEVRNLKLIELKKLQ